MTGPTPPPPFDGDAFARLTMASDPSLAPLPVAEAVRLSLLRNACPDGARVDGCGCSDLILCRRGKGREGLADRQTCYDCIRSGEGTS